MKNLLLIDANSLIHRCYHALPPFTAPDGKPTGALYGLASILIKIAKERKPDYIAAFFDRPEPTFREVEFPEYKIHRPPTPDPLISQIIESHNLFLAFKIKTFEIPGFEADDLIGTAATKIQVQADIRIGILSGDSDLLQLVHDDNVEVEILQKGISETKTYNARAVREKFGVAPEQLPEYKGLVGDPSDNIPGASGVGPKGAQKVIQAYGTIERFLKEGMGEKLFKKIAPQKERVILSRRLSTIRRDAPLEIQINELKLCEFDEEIISYFREMGFKSLVDRVQNKTLF